MPRYTMALDKTQREDLECQLVHKRPLEGGGHQWFRVSTTYTIQESAPQPTGFVGPFGEGKDA